MGLLPFALSPFAGASTMPERWDTFSDTWVATDALGRSLPTAGDVGALRADRFVGIFYFLWLGAHVQGGPYDITKILARDPQAMQNPESPLWGPLGAMHHWGEPWLGYYVTPDPFVLKKHAQMLADAGVDVVIFDVTNQHTYRNNYLALLKAFSEVRQSGGRTPQVAFLCPFGNPAKVLAELFQDLYGPGLYADLWFRWEGKPLILANPTMLPPRFERRLNNQPAKLLPGHSLGQSLRVDYPIAAVGCSAPSWGATNSGVTLTLYQDGPKGKRLVTQSFVNIHDNGWLTLVLPQAAPAGTYYLEMSEPKGTVGWWSSETDLIAGGRAHAEGVATPGGRSLRIEDETVARLRQLFTYRKPQPSYFVGPTGPDQWSWLEVYPQHVFTNAHGVKEQMTVGVAQNAVGDRLGSMSEPGARGRSYHQGREDLSSGAELRGYNMVEQWERALKEDPRFIFITGWNEWIASRFKEFSGVKRPVMFVDTFDLEHSRDIEPMKGGHGDSYYYQMVSYIRRYKGARPAPSGGSSKTIDVAGGFGQWADVNPEYRDDAGDTWHRDHPGYNSCAQYVNRSGRNDFVLLKVAHDENNLYFYARTREPITPPTDTNWMMLFLDVDSGSRPGWNGYDYIINRNNHADGQGSLEKNQGGWKWQATGTVKFRMAGNELHLIIPRAAVGLEANKGRLRFDFKWADNVPASGEIMDFIDQGDVAPNGRFNYRYEAR